MKLGFLDLPSDERLLYIEQAALRRNVSPVVLEKDFWVCWLLGILFESPFAGNLVFKGGTSLSKVFGVIERFSEDIDLSLSPAFLNLPEAGKSRNQATKWMAKAEVACGIAVRDQISAAMEAAVEQVLGKRNQGWFERSFTRNTTDRWTSRHPTGSHAITRILRHLQSIRQRAEHLTNTTFATALSGGRVGSLEVLGQTTTWRRPEISGWFRQPRGCLLCNEITRQCETCTSLNQPTSTTSSRPWPNWKTVSTTLMVKIQVSTA